jgi:hypothetical protein
MANSKPNDVGVPRDGIRLNKTYGGHWMVMKASPLLPVSLAART